MSIWIQQGWQCPCCNRVYSPTTPVCFHCPSKVTVASNSTPQRTWMGLTNEEKADLFEGTAPYYNELDYADAIEAKLKEKNT